MNLRHLSQPLTRPHTPTHRSNSTNHRHSPSPHRPPAGFPAPPLPLFPSASRAEPWLAGASRRQPWPAGVRQFQPGQPHPATTLPGTLQRHHSAPRAASAPPPGDVPRASIHDLEGSKSNLSQNVSQEHVATDPRGLKLMFWQVPSQHLSQNISQRTHIHRTQQSHSSIRPGGMREAIKYTSIYIYIYTRIKRALRARNGLWNYITG